MQSRGYCAGTAGAAARSGDGLDWVEDYIILCYTVRLSLPPTTAVIHLRLIAITREIKHHGTELRKKMLKIMNVKLYLKKIFFAETCLYIKKISFTLSQNPSGSFLTDNLSL